MNLFLVHCGFYETEVSDGIYESHVNLMVVAENFEKARSRARLEPMFQLKRMHVDGIQQIDSVQGFRIELVLDPALESKSRISASRHQDL